VILVTVGTQLPFDRLVRAVDLWAAERGRDDVVAQTGSGSYRPRAMTAHESLPPSEFRRLFEAADIIVGHAGIGTILAALELAKPVLIMPRKASLGEQRTDHQIATAERFGRLSLVSVAETEDQIGPILDGLVAGGSAATGADLDSGLEALRGHLAHVVSAVSPEATFDGIVCFGGVDWWYHNRGHYDVQMMREASKQLPVLYVNSIGVRRHSTAEGRMFFSRVRRKLKSLLRGLVRVRRLFHVFTPVSSAGLREGKAGRWFTAIQVRRAARRAGIRRPFLWAAVPAVADLLPYLSYERLIYQRTDQFEEFDPGNRDKIARMDRELKQVADLTLFASHYLLEHESADCRRALFVDHGVDFQRFRAAGESADEPADVASIPRPRAGFVGGIDAHTFNADLFISVAAALPNVSFVLVGGSSLPSGWCNLANVHLLGRKPYDEVPGYMAACDVLLMPWNDNKWIRACNPVKLKEYLTVGRPVVSAYFPELDYYDGMVEVAQDSGSFAEAILGSIGNGRTANSLDRFEQHQWADKFHSVCEQVCDRAEMEPQA
jgi:UDP-N-acetylglucosamine transferase subunit ALG13